MSTHESGKAFEDLAEAYLKRRGWRVLERNFRTHAGEVDLIVRRAGTLAFVEVKGRLSRAKGDPLEAIPPPKVRRISAAAALYLAGTARAPGTVRFDVVTVGPDRNWLGRLKVRHLENAFSSGGAFTV